jgi:UDPglucose 6-dehydrogenase
MKIGVVGTGYVGLVTGTCFAELGNDVTCVDNNPDKVAMLLKGEVPIFEPDLQELVDRNVKEGRLHFTDDRTDILGAAAIFLALPTPPGEGGEADLSYVLNEAEELGRVLTKYTVIVDKSTVPVGTAEKVRERIAANAKTDFDVVSNPEFLREGSAVADFLKPDRIVVGTSSDKAKAVMSRLYTPLVRREPQRLIFTDEASAEMIKYANNAMLAVRISFMNELSQLCERTGADIESVRSGIGTDARIGSAFLYPGPGYGGSCFPKDTLAIATTAKQNNVKLGIVEATIEANERQKKVLPEKVLQYFDEDIEGRTFALWGLAFKDNTDDVRESPALTIIDELTKRGAKVVAFDPKAIETTKREVTSKGGNENLSYAEDEYSVLKNADALVIATNWKEFFSPDFNRLKELLKAPVIFDGRNLYDPEDMRAEGFHYESIGRRTVNIDE